MKEQFAESIDLDYLKADNHKDIHLSFNNYLDKIKSFEYYPKGWDSFDTEPPSKIAIKNAIFALKLTRKHFILPERVNASADEGIIFEFLKGDKYYLIEFYNDGDIVYLKRENTKSEAFDITNAELEGIIKEIKNE